MRGSTVANVKIKKIGGPVKGSTIANTGTKAVGVAKARVNPNQNLKTKSYKGKAIGTVQGLSKSIHKNRGGSAMKAIFRGKA